MFYRIHTILYSPVRNEDAKIEVHWLYGYLVTLFQEEENEDGKLGKNVEITFWVLHQKTSNFVYWLFFTRSSPCYHK